MFATDIHRRHVLAALIGGLLPASARAGSPIRIEEATDSDRRDSFLKVIADTSGATALTWSSGSLFAWMPGLGGHHVCDIHGLAAHQLVKTESGWSHRVREGVMFSELNGVEPLTGWHNPFTQQNVSVGPAITHAAGRTADSLPENWTIGDFVGFADNRSTLTDAPMSVEDYPLYAQSDLFKFVNLNTYYAPASEVASPVVTSAPMSGINTSVSPWLPWMEMGQRRGWLVWQQRLKKAATTDEIPAHITAYWDKTAPDIFEMPALQDSDQETPWTSFKSDVDAARRASP